MTPKEFRKKIINNKELLLSRYDMQFSYSFYEEVYLEEGTGAEAAAHGTFPVKASFNLEEDYYFIYSIELENYGFHIGDEPDGTPTLYNDRLGTGKIEVSIESVNRLNPEIILSGFLIREELRILENSFGVNINILGVKRNEIPKEFYKETVGEAICLQNDNRLKQAYFTLITAADRQNNDFLYDLYKFDELSDIKYKKLEDKLRINIKRFINSNDIESIPLAKELIRIFTKHVSNRNEIAHSLGRVDVKEKDIEEVMFFILSMEMIKECGSANIIHIKKTVGIK